MMNRRDILFSGLAIASSSEPGKLFSVQAGANEEPDTSIQIEYLEIVTPRVDDVCKLYAAAHGVTFSKPDANLGGARTAKLNGGGMLGVRGPLRESEKPVVRPYVLVKDIKSAVDAAIAAGAEVALPSMKLPGHGTCAIVVLGGIDIGFWQK